MNLRSVSRIAPIRFGILNLPFGISSGFVTVTLGYLLTQHGMGTEAIAGIVALNLLPNICGFLWAPLVDATLSYPLWYLLGSALTALGLMATGMAALHGVDIWLLGTLVLAMSLCQTLIPQAVNALIPHLVPLPQRGTVSGWAQAGVIGGTGLGGGAALWLSQHAHPQWLAAVAPALLGLLCALALRGLPSISAKPAEHTHAPEPVWQRLKRVVSALWQVARSRNGFLSMTVCFLPIGTGAAANLFSAIANDWHASADTVATTTGLLAGVLATVGSVAAGPVCDRLPRRLAYVLFGIAQAACLLAMVLSPHNQAFYIVYTLLYALSTGMVYAGFNAVAFELATPHAGATQVSALGSLGYIPITYMSLIDGWGYEHHGAFGLGAAEIGMGLVGIVTLLALSVTQFRQPSP